MNKLFAKSICLLFLTAAISACKGGANRSTAGSQTDQDPTGAELVNPGPTVIHLDDSDVPLYDTLSTDNLIESYKYVPLSSVPGAMVLGGCPIKVDHTYLMVSGTMFRPEFKLFGDDGEFLGNAIKYGRGPNEITNVLDYLVDYARRELVIISTEKIVVYDFKDRKTRTIQSDIWEPSRFYARLENGDFVFLPNNDYESDARAYRPAMIFYDSLFQKSDTVFRYAPKHRLIDDVTQGVTLGKNLFHTGNGTLYQDMTGDTVFRVGPDRRLIPEFVIDIPEKQKMSVSESERGSLKLKDSKITVQAYEASKDYICLSYHLDGTGHFGIWSRKTGQLLFRYDHPNYRHFMRVLLDGKVLEIPIGEFLPGTNAFVSSAPAAQMKHVFPDLFSDDNPVAIEVTLR